MPRDVALRVLSKLDEQYEPIQSMRREFLGCIEVRNPPYLSSRYSKYRTYVREHLKRSTKKEQG